MNAIYPSFNNRAVFITGGATGNGAALTTALARQGSIVALSTAVGVKKG